MKFIEINRTSVLTYICASVRCENTINDQIMKDTVYKLVNPNREEF